MALHKKPSCCGVKYSLMGSRVLQKTTVIYHNLHQEMQVEDLLLGESYTVHQFYAAGFSGPELISDSGFLKYS